MEQVIELPDDLRSVPHCGADALRGLGALCANSSLAVDVVPTTVGALEFGTTGDAMVSAASRDLRRLSSSHDCFLWLGRLFHLQQRKNHAVLVRCGGTTNNLDASHGPAVRTFVWLSASQVF